MTTGAPKPFYASEIGVLYAEDCMTVLPLIRDEVVDTVFADPFSSLDRNRDQRVPAHSRPASPEPL
jgi:DNA modification methylase